MDSFKREILNIANKVLDDYFPHRDGLRVQVRGINADFLVGITDSDYMADLLVYGYDFDLLAEILDKELNKNRISFGEINIMKVKPMLTNWGLNSNLIYAC